MISKFEELCQAYAQAKQKTLESRQTCQNFAEVFVQRMRDYWQAPIEQQSCQFDERGLMHFDTSLIVYEDPQNPESSASEIVVISWSLEKVLDNYIVTVYPWLQEFKLFRDEFDKFEEVYDWIFEKLKEVYIEAISLSEEGETSRRNLGWGF